uniref:Uncharacterized protein n=1 Tax=Amphimedon queenslandica TaxID=400682 RepID=A0A1X7US88_AMPQE
MIVCISHGPSGITTPTTNVSNTGIPVTHHCNTPEDCETSLVKTVKFPKVIEIPSIWTEHTQRCLNENCVYPDVRKEIVRTISVMLTAAFKEPEALAVQCERVTNLIKIKYPFLANS